MTELRWLFSNGQCVWRFRTTE